VLVLTRKTGDSIVIGTDVVVTVLEVRNDQVRIGITAPRSVAVHREEVYRQIAAENASAASGADALRQRLRAAPPRQRPGPPRSSRPPQPPAPSGGSPT